MVGDMHRCTNQEHVETFANESEKKFNEDREKLKNELSSVIEDPGLIERVLEALSWTISTAKDSNRDYSSWDSCVQDCAASAIVKLPWYGQSPDCLSNEDRRKEPPPDTECQTQCDSRAEAWLNSIQMLHGFAFSGATLLIGLQVFVALLWDHEEMFARPKCSCPRDLVRAKEQWLAITASTLLIVCLWLQQTSVAYDENRRCEFHGEQTPFANERLMLSWSVLVIVMFLHRNVCRNHAGGAVVDAWRLCKS